MTYDSVGMTNVFLAVIAIISLAVLFMLYRMYNKSKN
jgi:cbb3-type cytochrome oxidase subunit 3